MPVKLLVVGGGRMGGALISGLLASEWASPGDIAVVEPMPDARAALSAAHPGLVVWERPEPDSVAPDGGAVLAVKPDIAESVVRGASPRPGAPRVLSVVAGLSTERLEAALPAETVVVRAMPNTPVAGRRGGLRDLGRQPGPLRGPRAGPRTSSRRWGRSCGCPSASCTW